MISNGEIPKPDEKWKELAPKSFKEKPSKEYLEALEKYSVQVDENMKKVKKKLFTLSDAEAERLKDNMGSSISNQISYWQKLKMVTSYWDILWFLLAVSTAWGLGNGTSSLSGRECKKIKRGLLSHKPRFDANIIYFCANSVFFLTSSITFTTATPSSIETGNSRLL